MHQKNNKTKHRAMELYAYYRITNRVLNCMEIDYYLVERFLIKKKQCIFVDVNAKRGR